MTWTDAVERYLETQRPSSAEERFLAVLMRTAAETVDGAAIDVGAAAPDLHLPREIALGDACRLVLDDAERAIDVLMRARGEEVYDASQTAVAAFWRLVNDAREKRALALPDAYTPEAQEAVEADFNQAIREAVSHLNDAGDMVDALVDPDWVERLRDDSPEA